MTPCTHREIEMREHVDEDMHCSGWACLTCSHLANGECHHQSWCREDFCGLKPVLVEVPRRLLVTA